MAQGRFETFWAFFPYYLSEHGVGTNRVLHYIGTSLAVLTLLTAIVTLNPWLLLAVPVLGYGWAWVGHFFVEKNRPATFRYPVWSLMGDFVMLGLAVTGQLSRYMPDGPVYEPGTGPTADDAAAEPSK